MATALRECPFCGCDARAAKDEGGWKVACQNDKRCKVSMPGYSSRAAAAAAWNHRVQYTGLDIEALLDPKPTKRKGVAR